MSHYKPYPAYKNSGVEWIGPVPEHWEIKRLEHVVSTHRENVAPDSLNPVNVLHFSIPAVQEIGGARVEAGSTIDSNKLIVRCPQVLISKLNPRKGTVIIADRDAELLTVASTEFVPLVPQHGRSVIPFIAALAVSEPLRQLLESRVESVTRSHQRVAPEDILKASVAIPPVDEQSAIAAALDCETARIDALIAKKTRFIELLKEKRQALITHVVTKGLDPNVKMKHSGVEWIGEVPEHWKVCRLGSLYREAVRTGDPLLPILSISIHDGITDDELAPEDRDRQIYQIEDRTKYKRVRPNDLAYNMMRAWQGAFGAVAVDGLVSPAYVVAEPAGELRSTYIENLLRTPMAVEEMRRFSRGIADFRMRLYWEYFRDLHVCVPPLDEQDEILSDLSWRGARMEKLGEATERSIALLKERRSALITAAVTGKIDLACG